MRVLQYIEYGWAIGTVRSLLASLRVCALRVRVFVCVVRTTMLT